MWFDKKDEKLNKIRGDIISHSLNIENFLTFAILKYFHRTGSEKSKVFYNNVLNTRLLSFEDKINLFEKIPRYQKLKKFEKIKNNLREIQRTRNKLAHWIINKKKSKKEQIVIENPINKNKSLTIDAKFIEAFEKKTTDTIFAFRI